MPTLEGTGPALLVLLAAVLAVVLSVAFAPVAAPRARWAAAGGAGILAVLGMAAPRDLAAVAIVIVLLAAARAVAGGAGLVALRAPAFGALLLMGGSLLVRSQPHADVAGPSLVLAVVGLLAAIYSVPFLQPLPETGTTAISAVEWTSYLAPAAVAVLAMRVLPQLAVAAAPDYAALLVGFGLLNLFWGLVAGWLGSSPGSAWRNGLLAEVGFALVGFGLVLPDALAAAYLTLVSLLVIRLPLYLWASAGAVDASPPAPRGQTLLLAALFAGAAPFAGFTARILLLKAATQVAWPLALMLLLAMLLWLPLALRLARSVPHSSRTLAGSALLLTLSVAIGVYPQPLLRLAGV
jgi:hypothetical protein